MCCLRHHKSVDWQGLERGLGLFTCVHTGVNLVVKIEGRGGNRHQADDIQRDSSVAICRIVYLTRNLFFLKQIFILMIGWL